MDACIVLNRDYTYLHTVSWRRALTLWTQGKAEPLKYGRKMIRTAGGKVFRIPVIMMLLKAVSDFYGRRLRYNKKRVFSRDDFRCMYCGRKTDRLTIDHVVPLSRGGKTCFENCVTACKECNNRKQDKTPEEAGMRLLRKPTVPTIYELIRHRMRQFGHDEVLDKFWKSYGEQNYG